MTEFQKLITAALVEDDRRRRDGITKSRKTKQAFEERVGIIENSLISPRVYYYTVSLKEEPVSFEHFKDRDPNIRATQGLYSIKYLPSNNTKCKKNQHFQIGQDLIRWRVTVSGYNQWKGMAAAIPELGWIDRNSTLTHELFGIAQAHPGMAFFFTIDWPKYSQMINKKAEELGVDIDHKPFVAFKCSQKDYQEKYKGKQLAEPKQFYHYMKEIARVEKEIQ